MVFNLDYENKRQEESHEGGEINKLILSTTNTRNKLITDAGSNVGIYNNVSNDSSSNITSSGAQDGQEYACSVVAETPVLPSVSELISRESSEFNKAKHPNTGNSANYHVHEKYPANHLPPLRPPATGTGSSTYTSLTVKSSSNRSNQVLPSLSSLGLGSSIGGKLGSCSTIPTLRTSSQFSGGMRIDRLLGVVSPSAPKSSLSSYTSASNSNSQPPTARPNQDMDIPPSTKEIYTRSSLAEPSGNCTKERPVSSNTSPLKVAYSVCSLSHTDPGTGQPAEANSFVVEELNKSQANGDGKRQPRQCLWSTCAQIFTSVDDLVRHLYKLHVATNRSSQQPTILTEKDTSKSRKGSTKAGAQGKNSPKAADGDDNVNRTRGADSPEPDLVVREVLKVEQMDFQGVTSDFLCKWASCHALKNDTNDLIQHVCREHLGAVRILHRCHWKQCHEEYDHIDGLTNHLSTTHVGSGRHEYVCEWEGCERNGKPFTQRQRAMRHIQTHTGDKPFSCDTCKKKFSEAHIMQQHMRTHTGEKPYKCTENGCEKEFAVSSALTIHLRTHTGERPYQCRHTGCTKRFAESSNLTKHMRVHTGERPFKCPDVACGKTFSRPDQVTRHQRMHTGEKPFVCPIDTCSKKFATSTTCLNHIKHLHNLDQSSLAELGLSVKKRHIEESGPSPKVKRLEK
ncbi:zinc-finger protein [Mycoemilia scoparia]|uniref:Zinc-finger protein n=1 Tax=Mycoemilia scoparia TaxID=417184 RepID=A0A9W8DS57_9FUNG|nr:zinc-finger protein [Mycoemilia scoparia]